MAGARIPATLGIGVTHSAVRCAGIGIQKIRGKQRDALFVVTRVQHMPHRLQRPKRRLARAEIVQHQNFRLQHRLEDAHFRRLAFRVVAILNFFQKLAVVVKKACVPAQDNILERGNAQMRLPHAAWADQQ